METTLLLALIGTVGGLTGEERIVTTAAGFLREGEKVNIAPRPMPVANAS